MCTDTRATASQVRIARGPGASRISEYLLAVPAIILVAVLGLLYPVAFLVRGGVRFEPQIVPAAVIMRVQWETIKIATVVSIVVTLLAAATALLARRCSVPQQRLILGVSIFPLGVNIAFRVFGVQALITGPELVDSRVHLNLLFTQSATIIGLVHWLFPIAVLVLFSALPKVRQDLLDSAELLGASRVGILFRITIPAISWDILLCLGLTFALAYGAYITPAALGGIGDITLSRLIGSLLDEGQAKAATVPALLGVVTPILLLCIFVLLFKRESYVSTEK